MKLRGDWRQLYHVKLKLKQQARGRWTSRAKAVLLAPRLTVERFTDRSVCFLRQIATRARWRRCAATVAEVVEATRSAVEALATVGACPHPVDARVLNASFYSVGLEYGPAFQSLDAMWTTRSGAQAAVEGPHREMNRRFRLALGFADKEISRPGDERPDGFKALEHTNDGSTSECQGL